MNENKKIRILINVVIPLVVGAVIYYLYSPEVVFVKNINSVMGLNYQEAILEKNNIILQFIRNYYLDMLWAYALVMTLFFIMYDNTVKLYELLGIAFSFTVVLEILQVIPSVKGTFDFCDILVELLTEVIAVFIIKNYFLKEKRG